jgi:hypothetical protein
MKRNYERVSSIVPKFYRSQLKEMSDITSAQFAVAVFIEFILFIPITYIAVEHQNYILFVGFNALLLVHVFTHVAQSLFVKSYTPGVVTGILVILPYSLYLFYRMIDEGLVTLSEVLSYAPTGILLLPIVIMGLKLGRKIVP